MHSRLISTINSVLKGIFMTPVPADSGLNSKYYNKQHAATESLAEHKFNQKRIMRMATRRGLVVQYFNRKWAFLRPDESPEHLSMSMPDEQAIEWLASVPYTRSGS